MELSYSEMYCQTESDSQSVEVDPVKAMKDRRKLLVKLGVDALLHYQKTEGPVCRLYQIVGDGSAFARGEAICYHLNLIARTENGSPSLFFAEVFQSELDSQVTVKYIKEMGLRSDMQHGCHFCRRKVLHPKGLEFGTQISEDLDG